MPDPWRTAAEFTVERTGRQSVDEAFEQLTRYRDLEGLTLNQLRRFWSERKGQQCRWFAREIAQFCLREYRDAISLKPDSHRQLDSLEAMRIAERHDCECRGVGIVYREGPFFNRLTDLVEQRNQPYRCECPCSKQPNVLIFPKLEEWREYASRHRQGRLRFG